MEWNSFLVDFTHSIYSNINFTVCTLGRSNVKFYGVFLNCTFELKPLFNNSIRTRDFNLRFSQLKGLSLHLNMQGFICQVSVSDEQSIN